MSNHRKTTALSLYVTLVLFCVATLVGLRPAAAQLQPNEQQVSMLGAPFAVTTTLNGAYVFVSVQVSKDASNNVVGNNGIEVLARTIYGYVYAGFVPLPTPPLGLTLSPDGSLLLAAAETGVAFIDVQRAITGQPGAWLGSQFLGANATTIEVAITPDQNYIFAANEFLNPPGTPGTISVISTVNALQSGFASSAVIGQIPAERHPVGLAISPDGSRLYITNEAANPGTVGYNPNACNIQTGAGTSVLSAEGTIQVVSIPNAEIFPSLSLVSRAVVGCNPVRIKLSAAGDVAWVSMRGGDHLKAFNTATLGLIASAPVGIQPVGVQLFNNGGLIAVANSARFTGGLDGTVSIVSTANALSNLPSTLKSFTVGQFPREWALSPDGSKLFLTEFSSFTLDIFDVPTLVSSLVLVSQ